MDNGAHYAFKAEDRSYFAIIKKEIHALAVASGLSEKRIGEADIVVAEMVSNLVKHAGGGKLWARPLNGEDGPGLEILSVDSGPGMTDVARMITDGVSTKNTLGQGLGAIKRLSDLFQVYSQKDWGTVLLARLFNEPVPLFRKPSKVQVRSIALPKPGEVACGDGFFTRTDEHHVRLFLGDGLGHGPQAEEAVQAAGAAFLECTDTSPAEIIRYINGAVRKSRGLVGTAALFDLKRKVWCLCGVGNITTRISGAEGIKNYMAYNGIIGLNVPNTLNVQEVPHQRGNVLVMCSDGLKSRWDPVRYAGLHRFDLSILAASLIKDFARLTDDMSAGACRINM